MRARDFLRDDELPDMSKDTWAGGGTEFKPDWQQQIGVDDGAGYQRAQGVLPGGAYVDLRADRSGAVQSPGPDTKFMPQQSVNISKGPVSFNLGNQGRIGGAYNVRLDPENSVDLTAQGQRGQGLQNLGAQYRHGSGFTAGVSQDTRSGSQPQLNVGYSKDGVNFGVRKGQQTDPQFFLGIDRKFEEDAELDEMAGEIHGGVRKALKDKGYRYLGSGIDKQAYLEPGTGQVLIIFGYRKGIDDFSPDQRMFINWIKYCNQHKDNPALPKFSGFESFQFQGKNYIQARMEALQELPGQIKDVVGYIENVADDVGNGDIDYALQVLADEGYFDDKRNQYIPYKLEKLLKLLGGKEKAQNLLNTVHAVAVFGTNQRYNLDLHSGNYMQRPNGDIVVNDPFVVWLQS